MQLTKKALMGGVAVLATTASVLASTISPAAAEPTRPYAATGSDTTQDVWNGLTNDFGAPIPSVANWDAFVTGQTAATQANSFIRTKSGGVYFQRPAGSTNGVRSLSEVWDGAYGGTWPATGANAKNLLNEDVDFARSSSGPASGTGLTYIPFGRDAISMAFNPAAGLTTLNLTTAEITSIYNGVDASGDQVTFSAQPATAGTVVSINGVPVQPKVPQQGSGTRNFFNAAIGVTTPAPYVSDPALPGGLPENDGTVLPNDGDLIVFSAAQFIAQRNGKVTNTTTGLELASINGSAATTGTAPTLAPGPLFGGTNLGGDYNTIPTTGVGAFNRDTYNVIPTAFRTGTSKQTTLVGLLGGTAGVYGGNAKTVIKSFGFGTLSYGATPANWLPGNYVH